MNNERDRACEHAYENNWWESHSRSAYTLQRVVRPKEEWAGKSLAHAYDKSISWSYRQRAQREFMALAKSAQQAVHQLQGNGSPKNSKLSEKLQLSAFHTSYPSPAQVAIGHTVFLELKSCASNMSKQLVNECNINDLVEEWQCKPTALQMLINNVSDALAARAVLAEAARDPHLQYVEYYQLFQASQCSLKFRTLKDCIEAVVLFGELLPDPDTLSLHPMTRQLFHTIVGYSNDFIRALPDVEIAEFYPFFSAWTQALIRALAPTLPKDKSKENSETQKQFAKHALEKGEAQYQYDSENPEEKDFNHLPPLDEPRPPALTSESSLEDNLKAALSPPPSQQPLPSSTEQPAIEPTAEENEMEKALNELQSAVLGASGQTSEYGDQREDLLERALASANFAKGPIEGTPTEGRLLEFKLNGEEVGGQIHDRPVELSDDLEKIDRLQNESNPLAATLRGILYPSEKSHTRIELMHTSGALDPKRLAIAEFCEAAYRRFAIHKEPSPSGKAVLLIAADGSGSLSNQQMWMCKLLMASWLRSASHTNVEILAALYHSGNNHMLSHSPLIQWVHHPEKTPVFNPSEALRAVASLPDSGTGVQSDALSLKFMIDEALHLAKGSRVYLTLISDCAWNKCFPAIKKSPEEELSTLLEDYRAELGDRLHTTLVALENRNQKDITKAVDKVVIVDKEALLEPEKVAQQIGQYVASCIRERRRAPKRRAY